MTERFRKMNVHQTFKWRNR